MRTQDHYKWDGERRGKDAAPSTPLPAAIRLSGFARDTDRIRKSLSKSPPASQWNGFIFKVLLPALGFLAASAITMRVLMVLLH
ncbi:MAG TPA: hypothetical protein VFP68_07300 [Burkholderiaceae bacterium]|nr:hypothetical protein [Burkholderiaceae bacterium]